MFKAKAIISELLYQTDAQKPFNNFSLLVLVFDVAALNFFTLNSFYLEISCI